MSGGTTASSGAEAKPAASQPPQQRKTQEPEPEAKAKPKPKLTVSQKQAIEAAESYLDTSHFSKKGLLHQLKFEEFPKAEAIYAVEHVEVNWTAEADEAAESYLDSGHFSYGTLLRQLKFEGFTDAQAAHGVKSVGL